MENRPNRAGRGEALRKFLRQVGEQPPQAEPEPPSGVQRPAEPVPKGRAAIFARLLSDIDKRAGTSSSELDTSVSSTPAAAGVSDVAPAAPRGRAKFLEMIKKTSSQLPCPGPAPAGEPPHISQALTQAEKGISEISMRPKISDDPKDPVVMMGTSGTKLGVVCNYIRLKVEKGKGVFQYDVQFSPCVDSRNVRFHLLKGLAHKIGDTKSFDGHILYLPYQLPDKVTIGKGTLVTDNTEIEIKITFVKQLYTGHREVIHLYNVLFKRIMNILGLVLHGDRYFDPKAHMSVPAHKLEIWPGFITAIEDFEGGVMLCCDASHRVLRTQTVHQFMMELQQRSKAEWKTAVTNAVVGQTVLTRYNNKIYRVDDIDFDSTPRNSFPYNDSEITYIKYYEKQYGVKIQDENQPLLKSRVKGRIKGQVEMSMVDLIPELCYLSGLTDEMRADMRVMKDVAQYTRISPAQRQTALCDYLKKINSNQDVVKLLQSWGLSLDSDSISLEARVLAPEDIYFANNVMHKGSHMAEWTRTATSSHVLSAIELRQWVIVCTKRDESKIGEFIAMVMRCAPQIGITVTKPKVIGIPNDSTQNYTGSLNQAFSGQLQMAVIVFPNARADKYSAVKKLCCITNPVPSQVILTRTISKPDKLRSVTQKIMLQMNCKLGGTLWSVKMPLKSTLILGLDTYHDPGRKNGSIGAVVASLNPQFTRWYSKVYRQQPGVELNDGLEVSVLSCLLKFREVNGVLPEQVIMYRDGVGDGDLSHCRDHEITQILTGFKRISSDYCPKFLVVIVQKRINTRIYAKERGGYSNPPPGTVMDHTVCRRNFYDFFLVAQNVRQGTVTPTHYVVIYNTTNMNPDQVQRISYKLTHMYYNWSGTVRVPAPCQYAHKLASLVGESIHKEAAETLNDKLYYL